LAVELVVELVVADVVEAAELEAAGGADDLAAQLGAAVVLEVDRGREGLGQRTVGQDRAAIAGGVAARVRGPRPAAEGVLGVGPDRPVAVGGAQLAAAAIAGRE